MKHVFLLAAVLLALLACNDEPNCPDCLNGGVCNDGSCDCPEGFTGDSCQTEKVPLSVTIDYVQLLEYSDTCTCYNPPNYTITLWDEDDASYADVEFFMVSAQTALTLYDSDVVLNVDPHTGTQWDTNIKLFDYEYNPGVYITFTDNDGSGGQILEGPPVYNTLFPLVVPGEKFPSERVYTLNNGVKVKLGLIYQFAP
ncbi:MAG: hypothetical protein IT270_13240 [Saprospiraceae bacterium]|nr:hypothetical protein [Saprospiraceae bacterium]